jgi:hypothetical protein
MNLYLLCNIGQNLRIKEYTEKFSTEMELCKIGPKWSFCKTDPKRSFVKLIRSGVL